MTQALATRIETLQDLSIARLRDCLDPRSGRFARQVSDAAWMPITGPETLAGSAICLIGLGRAGIPPRAVLPDAAGLCRRLAAAIRDEAQPGAVGLVLWANSALRALAPLALLAEAGFAPEELGLTLPGMTTTEVAWLASGLLHAEVPALRPATITVLRELEGRLDRRTLVFAHASAAAPWRLRLRRHIGDFADQAFGMQALAFAATVLGDPERRRLADRIGCRMVAAQGPLGQWWAQHDSRDGVVAERYPVLSVQQHSIGPMALRALALAGGRNHAAAATGSRAWLHANELSLDLVEPSSGIIWGGLDRGEGPVARRLRQARRLAGMPEPVAPRLALRQDMLPREWGWLLYASALEGGGRPAGHIL